MQRRSNRIKRFSMSRAKPLQINLLKYRIIKKQRLICLNRCHFHQMVHQRKELKAQVTSCATAPTWQVCTTRTTTTGQYTISSIVRRSCTRIRTILMLAVEASHSMHSLRQSMRQESTTQLEMKRAREWRASDLFLLFTFPCLTLQSSTSQGNHSTGPPCNSNPNRKPTPISQSKATWTRSRPPCMRLLQRTKASCRSIPQ